MLIISQDRRKFVNINCIDGASIIEKPSGYYTIEYKDSSLGKYKTVEDAEKSLEDITEAYNLRSKKILYGKGVKSNGVLDNCRSYS